MKDEIEKNNNQLPKDWKWVKLGEACEIVSGNTPKGLESISNKGEYQFYKVSDMNLAGNEIRMTVSNLKLTLEEIKKLKVKVYQKGTVIFPKRGGAILTNKKRILSKDASFDLNVMGLLPKDKLSSDYLFYWIQKLDLSKIYDGSNVPQINNKNVAPLDFPLPPKPTQQAIVSKIEELFSELDKGIENLHIAQQQLKTYRQSVLKWAFEGKLSESGFTRLKDEQDLVNKEILQSSNSENRNSDKGELPKGWKWVKVEEATISLDNKRKPINKDERKKRIGNIPYYGANGQVGWIDDYIFNEPLVCVVEDETFTGREIPFSYKITGKSWVNNHAHVLKPKDDLNIDFLNYQLYYYPFLRLTTGTTGRKKLTKNALSNAPIKVCSISEQIKIVQAIESRLSVSDKMEESITQSLQQAEALRQSILKKAFEGRLI